jgi:hypothetical protein
MLEHCPEVAGPHRLAPPAADTQAEVESLYKRFRSLDRGKKGYISAEEFLGIPELSINPLAQRLVRQQGHPTQPSPAAQ